MMYRDSKCGGGGNVKAWCSAALLSRPFQARRRCGVDALRLNTTKRDACEAAVAVTATATTTAMHRTTTTREGRGGCTYVQSCC